MCAFNRAISWSCVLEVSDVKIFRALRRVALRATLRFTRISALSDKSCRLGARSVCVPIRACPHLPPEICPHAREGAFVFVTRCGRQDFPLQARTCTCSSRPQQMGCCKAYAFPLAHRTIVQTCDANTGPSSRTRLHSPTHFDLSVYTATLVFTPPDSSRTRAHADLIANLSPMLRCFSPRTSRRRSCSTDFGRRLTRRGTDALGPRLHACSLHAICRRGGRWRRRRCCRRALMR